MHQDYKIIRQEQRESNEASTLDENSLLIPKSTQVFSIPLPIKKICAGLLIGTMAFSLAAGEWVVGYAQTISILISFGGAFDTSELRKPVIFLSALSAPSFAFIGLFALITVEAIELLWPKNNPVRSTPYSIISKIKLYLSLFPIEVLWATVVSVLEGTIVFTNLGFIVNYFGPSLLVSPWLGLNLALTTLIVLSNLILYTRESVDYSIKGYVLNKDYTKHIKSSFWKSTIRFWVNALPVMSAMAEGALYAGETYQWMQLFFKQIDHEDIANIMAFLPTFPLVIAGAVLRLAFCGRRYKLYLAKKVLEKTKPKIEVLHNDLEHKNLTERLQDFITKLPSNFYKLAIYGVVLMIVMSSFSIAYAALDELAYIIGEIAAPPSPSESGNTVYHSKMPLWLKLLSFIPFSIAMAVGALAVEGISILKLANLDQGNSDPQVHDELSEDEDVHSIEQSSLSDSSLSLSSGGYSMPKALFDLLVFTTTVSLKISADLINLSDASSISVLGFRESIMTSSRLCFACFSWCIVLLQNARNHSLSKVNENLRTQIILLQSAKNSSSGDSFLLSNEMASADELASLDNVSIQLQAEDILPLSKELLLSAAEEQEQKRLEEISKLTLKQILWNAIWLTLTVGVMTLGIESLFRYVIFCNALSPQEQLVNSQMIATIVGGLSATFAIRRRLKTIGTTQRFFNVSVGGLIEKIAKVGEQCCFDMSSKSI